MKGRKKQTKTITKIDMKGAQGTHKLWEVNQETKNEMK
jgi:hypothetical protein